MRVEQGMSGGADGYGVDLNMNRADCGANRGSVIDGPTGDRHYTANYTSLAGNLDPSSRRRTVHSYGHAVGTHIRTCIRIRRGDGDGMRARREGSGVQREAVTHVRATRPAGIG